MLAACSWNTAYEAQNREDWFKRFSGFFLKNPAYQRMYDMLNNKLFLILANSLNDQNDDFFNALEKIPEAALPCDLPAGKNIRLIKAFTEKILIDREFDIWKKNNLSSSLVQ